MSFLTVWTTCPLSKRSKTGIASHLRYVPNLLICVILIGLGWQELINFPKFHLTSELKRELFPVGGESNRELLCSALSYDSLFELQATYLEEIEMP